MSLVQPIELSFLHDGTAVQGSSLKGEHKSRKHLKLMAGNELIIRQLLWLLIDNSPLLGMEHSSW